jgi:ribose transport system permease protein
LRGEITLADNIKSTRTILPDSDEKVSGKHSLNLQKIGAFLGLILLGLFFSFANSHFLQVNNLMNIALQTSIVAIVAIGQTYVIIKGGIDLSVGSIAALAGVIAAEMMTSGSPIWLSVLVGVLGGVVCGLINGAIISYGKIPPFIATLGMMGIARGAVLVITDGIPVSGLPKSFSKLGGGTILGIPMPIIILVIIAIIMAAILARSRFGRSVYAIGSNEKAAYLSGINVNKTKLGVYGLSGLLAGIAGVILTSRLVSAAPTAGQNYELDAIAAAVIGGASLSGGVGTVMGTLIGAFIMGILRNGLNLLGVSYYWQQIAIGVVIIGAVYIDTLRQRSK